MGLDPVADAAARRDGVEVGFVFTQTDVKPHRIAPRLADPAVKQRQPATFRNLDFSQRRRCPAAKVLPPRPRASVELEFVVELYCGGFCGEFANGARIARPSGQPLGAVTVITTADENAIADGETMRLLDHQPADYA